jgi:hypothetical protein
MARQGPEVMVMVVEEGGDCGGGGSGRGGQGGEAGGPGLCLLRQAH